MSIQPEQRDGRLFFDFAPELESLASSWELYQSITANMGNEFEPRREQPCMRCRECDSVVYPPDTSGVMVHLIGHHGWRMDGSRDPEYNIVRGED